MHTDRVDHGRSAASSTSDLARAQARIGVRYRLLASRDTTLRELARRHGRPDPFSWEDGGRGSSSNFAAMLLHIVSQQISTRVAFLLFDRIAAATDGPAAPASIATLGPERLRALGLSRAKASSVVDLAERHLDGRLDTAHLDELSDADVISALTEVRGVGRWTAEMFLIHQLRRPDVLPAGDLGIRHAVAAAWGLPAVPSIDEVRSRGESWRPHRTFAAALLWASLKDTQTAPAVHLAEGFDAVVDDAWHRGEQVAPGQRHPGSVR